MRKILCFIVFLFVTAESAHASDVTHTLGTTGYMIREAMWAKAYKYDKQNYREAVKLQYEARARFRGTHKKGRNLNEAVSLSRQAYDLAKTARDTALSARNMKVAR
jgi:hypothetical protein